MTVSLFSHYFLICRRLVIITFTIYWVPCADELNSKKTISINSWKLDAIISMCMKSTKKWNTFAYHPAATEFWWLLELLGGFANTGGFTVLFHWDNGYMLNSVDLGLVLTKIVATIYWKSTVNQSPHTHPLLLFTKMSRRKVLSFPFYREGNWNILLESIGTKKQT